MTFSAYISIVVTAICATTLIDVVMSDGETKKFVKSISSILVLAALIIPLPSLFGSKQTIDIGEESVIELSEGEKSYLDGVFESKVKQKEAQIKNALNYSGITEAVVRIDAENIEGKCVIRLVTVNLQNAVISHDIVNIDITKLVKDVVTKSLNVDENLILVVD